MRRLIVIIPLALEVLAIGPSHAQSAVVAASARTFPTDAAVLAIVRQRVDDKRSAGIVVGMLEPDGRTRVVAFGDPGQGQPPLDGNSVF